MLGKWELDLIQNDDGNAIVVAGATVTVRRESTGALAQLYGSQDGDTQSPPDTKPNPFTLGASETTIKFWASVGDRYRIDITQGTFSRTLRYESVKAPPISDLIAEDFLPATSQASARSAIGLGSAATKDVGTSVGNVVQLEQIGSPGVAGLPAVDGSQLTGITLPLATETTPGTVEKATQAEMEAETADKYPDAALVRHSPGVAKAWVNFSGTDPVAIRNSYNVLSITDNGTGNYTINLSITMSSTGFAAYGSCANTGASADQQATLTVPAHTTTSVRLTTTHGNTRSFTDVNTVSVAVHGDL